MAFNYTMGGWKRESSITRAQCVAHFITRGIREAYAFEKATEKQDKANKKPEMTSYSDMLRGMGILK